MKMAHWKKKMNFWKLKEIEKLMKWEEHSIERRKFLDKRTLNFNKRVKILKVNRPNSFLSTRLIEQNGSKKRVDSWLLRKTLCKNWNQSKENKRIKLKKSKDWRSKTRETTGELHRDKLVVCRLITPLLLELELAFWADSTLVEVELGSEAPVLVV